MKRGMTIEYLNCRADLNFEVDFRVNGAIGTIMTKCYIHNMQFYVPFILVKSSGAFTEGDGSLWWD